MRFLVIEDDSDTVRYIGNGLEANVRTVAWGSNGVPDLTRVTNEQWDPFIFDRMLRHKGDVILSAAASIDERVHGLRRGGDVYLTNPCLPGTARTLRSVVEACRHARRGGALRGGPVGRPRQQRP